MKRTTSHQYDIKFREQAPILQKVKTGTLLMCPFCPQPHPLWPGQEAECGTQIVVKAVQTVVPEKRAKRDKIVCLKCHQSEGGDMVRFMNGWIHVHDCAPGMSFLVAPPKFSKLAGFAYGLGEENALRRMIEARNGKAQIVKELDAQGKETGKTLGHIFYKEQQVNHGKNTSIGAR